MSLDKELSGIARFNGDEFHIWKWQMKSLLQYKKIHTIVNGTETLQDAEDKEAWQAREYAAFTLLCNSVERLVLTPLLQCTTSHEIWTTLLSIYEHKSSADVHELQRRFFTAKIQPEQSLADYIGDLQLILSELADIGDTTFTKASLISKLTSTLPEGYDSFLTAWDSTPADERTFANLQVRLYKEEARLKSRITSETSSDTTAFYSQKSFSPHNSSHTRHTSSGSSHPHNHSRNSGRYQPTGSQYQSRISNPVPRTSYGDRQTPYNSTVNSHRTMELQALKARTRCNCCGRLGHWWQECPDRDQRPLRASLAEAHSSYSPDELTSNMSTVDITDETSEPNFFDSQLSVDNPFPHESLPDAVTKSYMATDSFSSLDIENSWIADSGANKHMSHNFQWFHSYKPLPSTTSWPITAIAGHQCYVAGTGSIKVLVQLPHKVEIILLQNVLYVPGLQCNLFSTTLMAKKHSIDFIGTQTHCHFVKNNELIFTGRLLQDMYILDFTVLLPPIHGLYTAAYGNIPQKEEYQPLQIWHHRLGHLHFDMIKTMARNGAVTGLHLTTQTPTALCPACQFGKMTRKSFPENHFRTYATSPGDLLHGDICGPMSQPSKGGSVYFILYQDDFTGYRFVFCVNRKSEALTCFQQVFKTILRETGRTISTLRTDRGGEFSSTAFLKYLSDNNIRRELTTSYTPEQNAVAERSNRTIMEGVRSSLHHSQLPMSFWAEAVVYIVYTLNRTCTRVHGDKTPFELYTGIKPSLSHMRPFGCPVFVYIPAQLRKKLDAKSRRGIFVGYSEESKAYRIWDSAKKQVVTTRDLIFDEAAFLQIPKSTEVPSITSSSPSQVLIPDIPTPSHPADPPTPSPSASVSSHSPRELDRELIVDIPVHPLPDPIVDSPPNQFLSDSLIPPADISHTPDTLDHSTSQSASQSDTLDSTSQSASLGHRPINPPTRYGDWYYSFTAMAGTLPPVPKSSEEALKSPNAKEWKEAMDAEFQALIENDTWELRPLPPGRQPIQCKWVYAYKTKPDGSLDRFKARLVAKGFSQTPGTDFHETFSPTVKYESIRLALAVAATTNMQLRQFDITTAFLNALLHSEIYMHQVPGYIDILQKHLVCYLKKALYGLRQASREWNQRIDAFLKAFKLTQSSADSCVYFSDQNGCRLLIMLFVDDGLMISNSSSQMDSVLTFMKDVFITKVTMNPELYVGIHLKRDQQHRIIYIDQELYITSMLQKYNFQDSHAVSTPAEPGTHLRTINKDTDETIESTFPYAQIIGSLQFAALTTRPDIAYAVNYAAQFKNHPTTANCNAVRRILKYLRGTSNFRIPLGGHHSSNILTAYADADYAAALDDRKSRSGYVIFFDGSPVSWASKKQPCVATSTTHSEYIACYAAATEVIWLRRLLASIGISQNTPTTIFTDSQSAMRLAVNPEFHSRTKHVDVKFHFLREQVVLRTIDIQYLPTQQQIVDIMTKALPPDQFRRLRDLLTLTTMN